MAGGVTGGGWEASGNTATLEFAEGSRARGATVVVSLDLPLGDYFAFQRALAEANEIKRATARGEDVPDTNDGGEGALPGLLRRFGEIGLVSWDVLVNGVAVPADADGLAAVPLPVAVDFVIAWLNVATTPSGGSPAASPNGAA